MDQQCGDQIEKIPAMYCEHANECPNICPCPDNCYCKEDKGTVNSYVDPNLQPKPKNNSNPNIPELVINDVFDKSQLGLKKYGTYLQGHNGRDALVDAYQEAIDLVQYLRQMIYERDGK